MGVGPKRDPSVSQVSGDGMGTLGEPLHVGATTESEDGESSVHRNHVSFTDLVTTVNFLLSIRGFDPILGDPGTLRTTTRGSVRRL